MFEKINEFGFYQCPECKNWTYEIGVDLCRYVNMRTLEACGLKGAWTDFQHQINKSGPYTEKK